MATVALSILNLFQNKKNCDITFKVRCGNAWSSFPAHKLILSIWSPVFAKKFPLLSDSEDDIEIVDIRPSVFCAFLNYLYGFTQELERNEKDIRFVLDVYKVASTYQVQALKNFCCQIFNSSCPNKGNVFDLIDAAALISSDCLKERCYRVLRLETEAILDSQDVMAVTSSMVITLLQLPSLWLSSEYELLTWVFKWAKSHYLDQQNIKSPKEIICQFLPFLNFTAIESKDFAMLVNNHREFFDEVECFDIFMNINLAGSSKLPAWFDGSRNSRQYDKPIDVVENIAVEIGTSDKIMNINNEEATLSQTNDNESNKTMDSNNEGANSSYLKIDKETQTDETMHINNEGATSSYLKLDNQTQTDETIKANNVVVTPLHEGNSSAILNEVSIPSSHLTIVPEMQTNEKINTNNEEANLPYDFDEAKGSITSSAVDYGIPTDEINNSNNGNAYLSAENDDAEVSKASSLPTVDYETQTNETINIDNEEATFTDGNSSAALDDCTLMTETEKGQKNSSILDIFDQEPGSSWESLKPPTHLKKNLKKKKIPKLYLLPRGKSFPNIGQWDSELEPLFLSGDFKSMSLLIEKQLSLPIAADYLSRVYM